MDSQVFILNEKRNVTLTAYLQDDSQEFWRAKKRPAVVIFPGGAYAYCSDREADPVAQEYLRAGYRAQRRWRSTVRLRRFWHIRSF